MGAFSFQQGISLRQNTHKEYLMECVEMFGPAGSTWSSLSSYFTFFVLFYVSAIFFRRNNENFLVVYTVLEQKNLWSVREGTLTTFPISLKTSKVDGITLFFSFV